jgi:hypothetical protein
MEYRYSENGEQPVPGTHQYRIFVWYLLEVEVKVEKVVYFLMMEKTLIHH